MRAVIPYQISWSSVCKARNLIPEELIDVDAIADMADLFTKVLNELKG